MRPGAGPPAAAGLPGVPPPARIEGEEPIDLRARDGTSISALGRFPADSRRVVVVCHPHPLYGGTMHNAVVVAVARASAEVGAGTLRFDFRGAGGSGGRHEGGTGEVDDALAAVGEARTRAPGARVALVGYSFGSFVALRAAGARPGEVDRLALVAPPVDVYDFGQAADGGFRGATAVFAGEADPFCGPDAARAIGARLGAEVTVVRGADHLFVRHRREIGRAVVAFAAPEEIP